MVFVTIIVTTLLIQLSCCYNEDFYPLSENLENPYLYPEELPEDDLDVRRRNSNFLRFGRSGRTNFEDEDYTEDFARPTRSGKQEKNDLFIRFGRSNKQDFLRFGRDPHKTNYLRFGRSAEKSRTKRETRNNNFLRFGRNSNFLRFGRNELGATADPGKVQDSPLVNLLRDLLENLKKEPKRIV